MEFIIFILLFVVVGTILTAVRSNKKKVNLTKQNNIHNSSNNSSPLFFFAGSIMIARMEVHMIVEDLSVEIAEAAAMVAEVAVIDENTPYKGRISLNKRLISWFTYA